MKCFCKIILATGLFFAIAPIRAAIITNAWIPVFKGVDYTTGEADSSEPRQQKVFAFRVDRFEPGIEFFSTPSNGGSPMETFGQTTTTFVNTYKVAFGINANFFSPVSTTPNEPRELSGLAISRGDIVSPFESGRPALLIARDNRPYIFTSAPSNLTNYWAAVAGSHRILINGVAQLADCTTSFCNENPRSAVGYSQNGRYIFLMVIDGRRNGWSDGATLYETGQWLLRLGAWNGLNLDGGGSTALAKMENGSAKLLNKPSSNIQRVDGNHFGVFAQAMSPVILAQPTNCFIGFGQSATFTVQAGGTTPLHYQWRFNGTNISSATNTSYTIGYAHLSELGFYSVVVSNAVGKVFSADAALAAFYPPAPPRFTSPPILSNGTVRLAFSTYAGRVYDLETSTNLVDWISLTNWLNQQSANNFLLNNPSNSSWRFYRVHWSAP